MLDSVAIQIRPNAASAIPQSVVYQKRYADARKAAMNMSSANRAKLAQVYKEAADEAAAIVKSSVARGLSQLTIDHWRSLRNQLRAAARIINQGVEDNATNLINEVSKRFTAIDADYVSSMARRAGAEDLITKVGTNAMAAQLNTRVVRSFTARVWSDGFTFSQRVWGPQGIGEDWLERMRMTIATGLALGRDPVKIARDIQVYTADGKTALVKRWGKLERGTAEFAKRLPNNLDWRAVRVVRSELYASLQDAAVIAGEANPGTTGYYDWILQPDREHWGCVCASYASGGPYKAGNLPIYPHPNCMCRVQPQLMNSATFVNDLARWSKGESVPYIDAWYNNTYKPAQAA